MVQVKDIMVREVFTIHQGDTVLNAAQQMAQDEVGLLVVLDAPASRRPVGVISDTDIIRKVVMQRKDPGAVWVKDLMTRSIIGIDPDATLADATAMMRKYKVKRLPVIRDGLLEGIVSVTDIIPHFINYKKKLLDLAVEF